MRSNHLLSQIRLSATVALRPALQFLLVTCISIPIAALIGLMFGDNVRVNWKSSVAVGTILGLAWFAAVFLSTLADSRKENRMGSAKTVHFPAQSFVAGLYGFAMVGSVWLTLQAHREREPLWIQILPLGLAAIAFYGWPRTITCGDVEVTQRSLLWRKRRIPYASVEAISVQPDGTTTVIGASTIIEHTPYHFGAAHFRAIISRRTGKPVYG